MRHNLSHFFYTLSMDSFITILCFVVAILIYFLPTIIALGRKHNYKWLILILNLFGAFQSFICGNISIDSDKQELYDVVNRQQPYSICTSSGTDSFDRVSTLLECNNWDIENLQPLNKYSVHICYAMHHFFTDDLFALSDILLLDKDDIQLSISIEL